MEGIEMENLTLDSINTNEDDDICSSILSHYSKSPHQHHQHLCTVIGAMAQSLKDQNVPLTPITYFGHTCNSIPGFMVDTIASSPNHDLDALVTILSLVLPRISPAILRKKKQHLSDLLVRVIGMGSLSANGVASGLKCVSHLLITGHDRDWSDVAQLYGILLKHMTALDQKVRMQSSICLRDVLIKFHGPPLLPPASEGITSLFERFLLLAGGSTTNVASAEPTGDQASSEGPAGAQGVLYILGALKDCLPHMSVKFITSILKRYKTLLEMRQPVLTRLITASLNVLCLAGTREACSDALLDLLCSLAISVGNETSADSMTFIARLLDVGTKKIFTINRQICVIKLPIVFKGLTDVLASEHEEAIFAAVEALKSLIHACIDECLIKEGVDQMEIAAKRSSPTIIGKVCATVESLLDYQYAAVWDMSFQVISTLFDTLGEFSHSLLEGTIKNLVDMQDLPTEDFQYRKQLHECIGSALGAMGPEIFLKIIPLNLNTEDQSKANIWLFPILKQYTVGASLSFFADKILGMIREMKENSRRLELEGRIVAARNADALVYSLWSLLPSFCDYPRDTAKSFKELVQLLYKALRDESSVRGIICSSLKILIHQNKSSCVVEKDTCHDISISKRRAIARYTSQVISDNMTVLRACGSDLLSILSKIFLQSTKDDGGSLQSTINEISSIADKAVVSRIFAQTMHKLLKVTKQAGKIATSGSSMQIDNPVENVSPMFMRAQLFDLAVSLLPGLSFEETEVLFSAIEPALQDKESVIQKKAYKVLSIILQNCDPFLSAKIEHLLQLMIEVLASCDPSAKRHRLHCLYFLIVHVAKGASEQKTSIISSFLTEIILSLKETNKRSRNKAYDLLVQIGHECFDEDRGGNKENLHQFFNMVAGGLAGENPHMISAAVKGLARLAYEFSDLVAAAYNVLPSSFLLLKRKNKELVKANLGFLKVLIAKSQGDYLQTHLKNMLEGLLKWQDSTTNHFKAKIKNLLEMLVKKCGTEAVKAAMPEEHMKLLTNIRKLNERKEKKQAANSEARSRVSKATPSRWNDTKIFSEFSDDDGESAVEYMDDKTNTKKTLRQKRMRDTAKCLPEDSYDQLEDEPLDLLDRSRTRSALRSSQQVKQNVESDDEIEIDAEGRLIINEEYKKKKEKYSDLDSDTKSHHSNISSKASKQTLKRRKTSETGRAYTGKEYASKKAVGDVKRKDKLEPFAYWPLDYKMMSRRSEHRATARKGMSSVVNMTKKLEGKSASAALSMKGMKFKRGLKTKVKKSNKSR